jgi:hypothetical protein
LLCWWSGDVRAVVVCLDCKMLASPGFFCCLLQWQKVKHFN